MDGRVTVVSEVLDSWERWSSVAFMAGGLDDLGC